MNFLLGWPIFMGELLVLGRVSKMQETPLNGHSFKALENFHMEPQKGSLVQMIIPILIG